MKQALKWINTGAFLLMAAVNILAELLPLGGRTIGRISEVNPNLFTPAPITFAIWGPIYLLMTFFTIYQHGVLDGGAQSTAVREKIGIWFAVSCLLNILRIILWHCRLIGLSAVCIVLLLIVLRVIVGRIHAAKGGILQSVTTNAGFSLYYGWILTATIANISAYLTERGWHGWGISADAWTVIVLLIGAAIAGAAAVIEKNRIAAIAVMWAYVGILIRHISPAYFGGTHPYVIAAAFVSEVLILAAILLPQCIRKCRDRTGDIRGTRPDK